MRNFTPSFLKRTTKSLSLTPAGTNYIPMPRRPCRKAIVELANETKPQLRSAHPPRPFYFLPELLSALSRSSSSDIPCLCLLLRQLWTLLYIRWMTASARHRSGRNYYLGHLLPNFSPLPPMSFDRRPRHATLSGLPDYAITAGCPLKDRFCSGKIIPAQNRKPLFPEK